MVRGFLDSSVGKESTCNAGDTGLIPGSGRSAGEEIGYPFQYSWASLVAQTVKNPPAMWEIPWRRAWQPTPVFLPGELPWTEEPSGLQSTGSQSWTRLSGSAQHSAVYVSAALSVGPTLCFPHCVRKSVLCVCICVPSLQTGSSVLFFELPYICINVQDLFF